MNDRELFAGLQALVHHAFPKRCACCGRVYHNPEEFFQATRQVKNGQGEIKPSQDDDGSNILEIFRNCVCGSTLMECFGDRRDNSASGLERRRRFGVLMEQLAARGVAHETAKAELLKLVRGQRSELIEALRHG